jgi:TPR repeat protein
MIAFVFAKGEAFVTILPAKYYFTPITSKAHPDAQCDCGYCLHLGEGICIHLAEAARFCKCLALAQFHHGKYLDEGLSVSIDPVGAADSLKRAADQGFGSAELHYGNWLSQGRCGFVDFPEPAREFKLTADQRLVEAQLRYGIRFYDAEWFLLNSAGMQYFKPAGDQDVADGQYCYGICVRESCVHAEELHTLSDWQHTGNLLEGNSSMAIAFTKALAFVLILRERHPMTLSRPLKYLRRVNVSKIFVSFSAPDSRLILRRLLDT